MIIIKEYFMKHHWKQGKLYNPFIYYFCDVKELGEIKIADEVVGLDIGISDEETKQEHLRNFKENVNYDSYLPYRYEPDMDIFKAKGKAFFERKGIDDNDVVCFGAGKCFTKRGSLIKQICNLKYVCDNDEKLWNKKIEGLECISPQQLKDMNNCFVIIMIYSVQVVKEITGQLEKLGIKSYISFMDVMNIFD
jgi:hypothetical protein